MVSDVVSDASLCSTWLVVLGSVELLYVFLSPAQPAKAKVKTLANKIPSTLFFMILFLL